MPISPTLQVNQNGGYYVEGKPFSNDRWVSIVHSYVECLEQHGSCSVRELAQRTAVSLGTARKAILSYKNGMLVPCSTDCGHGRKGAGVICGLQKEHHVFLYHLYKKKPSMPLYGYSEELKKTFGITISSQTILRWFNTIGPYKGSLRVTGSHPNGRETFRTCYLLQQYLKKISFIKNRKRLVFADEKPFKEIDIFGRVRRDVKNGDTPPNKTHSSSRNRYNILCAINIKGGDVPPVHALTPPFSFSLLRN